MFAMLKFPRNKNSWRTYVAIIKYLSLHQKEESQRAMILISFQLERAYWRILPTLLATATMIHLMMLVNIVKSTFPFRELCYLHILSIY